MPWPLIITIITIITIINITKIVMSSIVITIFTTIFDIITIMVMIIQSLVKICNRFHPMRKSPEITAPRKLPTTDLKSYPPCRIFSNNMDHHHHHHQSITAITQEKDFYNPGAYLHCRSW